MVCGWRGFVMWVHDMLTSRDVRLLREGRPLFVPGVCACVCDPSLCVSSSQ